MSSSENSVEYVKKEIPAKVGRIGMIMSAVGFVIVLVGYLVDPTRSAFNNIILLMFLTSVGLGSLFLVAIEYVGGAVWSTPFRRIPEFMSATLLILPIIVIPLLFNLQDVFHWMHPEGDDILKAKAPYLNTTFFIIRVVAFILIWLIFYAMLTGNSKLQDKSKDQYLTTKNIRISAIFFPFFAITLSLTSIDWMMSLEPHWFSTIYGVYYFSGTVLAGLAVATFIIVYLNEKGFFIKGINKDHYYSLGALLFAFINFWAYIAFSQFLLIYYANLPEETFWFIQRWEGSWLYVSLFLILVHFIVPYFGLLSQPSKMNSKRLMFMSVWILFAHIVDLYWLVMPTFSREGFVFNWIEVGYPLIAFGILILIFVWKSKKNNIVPIGDPKLKRGLDFRL